MSDESNKAPITAEHQRIVLEILRIGSSASSLPIDEAFQIVADFERDKAKASKKKLEAMATLLVECRDALPAISLVAAKLHGVRLDLADRIETELKPWEVKP